jgi:hypothetical protein
VISWEQNGHGAAEKERDADDLKQARFCPLLRAILDRDRFDMVKQKQMLVLFPNTGQKYSRGAEIDLTSFLTFSCFLTDTH